MYTFEILVPGQDDRSAAVTMFIDAEHWMDAWRAALAELEEDVPETGQVTCRIGKDGSVEVIASTNGRKVFVRTLETDDADADVPVLEAADADLPQAAPASPGQRAASPPTMDYARRLPVTRPKKAGIRRHRQRPGSPERPANGEVPYAPAFDGGATTSTREALDMLRRHVKSEAVQFMVAEGDRRGWRVMAARGSHGPDLVGLVLKSREPLPGPVDKPGGRRIFAGEGVPLKFQKGIGKRVVFRVKSALWASVRDGDEVRGVLLLLNARNEAGFTDGELSAVQDLASLLGRRLATDGASSD